VNNNSTNKDTLFGIRSDLLICLFLGLIALVVYWQVINHEFINYDDPTYVTDNHHVQAGLTLESLTWSFGFTREGTYWHPLTWLSHILDCQLYGLNPGMHHLTNLILHMASSIFLFLVLGRMTGALWKSAFVAALFALHPLNVDSVAWVAERKNVLSTFFWMLTMLTYAYYSKRPNPYKYLLTFFCFALGLLAKPMLVTLPFVLLLLDYWPLGRLRSPTIPSAFRLALEKVPFFVLSGVGIYLSASSVEGLGTVIPMELRPMELRVANALVSYVSYIGKMIWPQGLAIHYPYPDMVPIWKATCAGLFLVLVSLVVLPAIKRKPYLSVGWLWFLGTLVPVTGLVQVGLWPAMADRWAYVPLIGLFIMIAWGVCDLVARWSHKKTVLASLSLAILLVLMILSWTQVRYWKNSISLFEHALNVTSNNCFAHTRLALDLANQGRLTEAIRHFFEALLINPGYANAHNGLGSALTKQGRMDEAIRHFYEALRIDPGCAEGHYNLGRILNKQGRTDEAISHYVQALRINPDFAEAHNNLGSVLANQGRMNEAFSHFSAALQIKPRYAGAHYNLGGILANRGRMDEAIKHYFHALRINPGFAEAHNGLGVVLAKQGRVNEAISHYSEALRINPRYTEARNNLNSALTIKGE